MSYKYIYTYIPLSTFGGTAYCLCLKQYSTICVCPTPICCHHNFVPCSHKFPPCVCLFPHPCRFIVNYPLTLYPIVILSWVPILYPYQDMRLSTSVYIPLSSYYIFYVFSCCTNSPQLGFCWLKKYESNIKWDSMCHLLQMTKTRYIRLQAIFTTQKLPTYADPMNLQNNNIHIY